MTPTPTPTQRVPGARHPALTSAIFNAACVDAATHTQAERDKLTLDDAGMAAYTAAYWQALDAWHHAYLTRREHTR